MAPILAPITLDASVAAKWLLGDEGHVTHALALRRAIITGDLEVTVPPNFPLEIAHTLVKAVRRGRFPADELDNGVQAVLALELLIDGRPDLPRRAARLAHRLGTSAYDAAYLVTARDRDATLITADRPLHDAGLAGGFDVAWLGDLPA